MQGNGQVHPLDAPLSLHILVPTTRWELPRFLGMFAYYLRFCINVSSFSWTIEHQQEFLSAKSLVCNVPVLSGAWGGYQCDWSWRCPAPGGCRTENNSLHLYLWTHLLFGITTKATHTWMHARLPVWPADIQHVRQLPLARWTSRFSSLQEEWTPRIKQIEIIWNHQQNQINKNGFMGVMRTLLKSWQKKIQIVLKDSLLILLKIRIYYVHISCK